MKSSELLTEIMEVMNTVKRRMANYMNLTRGTSPLSQSQTEVFFTIAHQQPIGTKQLADLLSMTPGAVSQQTDILFQLGYLERETDTRDRRKQHLRVSDEGRLQLKAMADLRHQLFKDILDGLSDEELVIWLSIQQKMVHHLDKLIETNKKEK